MPTSQSSLNTQQHGYNYAAILLDDGSELAITDAMLEQSLNDPTMIELSQFLPDLQHTVITLH